MARQQLEGAQQQLREIDHALAVALRVVVGVEGDHAAREVVARLDRVGAQPRLLAVVDEVLQLARRELLLVQVLRLGQALDHRELVAGIEDLEELRQARVAVVRAQEPVAQAVEGAHPHAARVDGQHRREPREHLARRLVGEGDGEDARGARLPGLDEVGDARGEHARLAAAGAGEDEGGFARKGDGPELLGIEACEEIGHAEGLRNRGPIITAAVYHAGPVSDTVSDTAKNRGARRRPNVCPTIRVPPQRKGHPTHRPRPRRTSSRRR